MNSSSGGYHPRVKRHPAPALNISRASSNHEQELRSSPTAWQSNTGPVQRVLQSYLASYSTCIGKRNIICASRRCSGDLRYADVVAKPTSTHPATTLTGAQMAPTRIQCSFAGHWTSSVNSFSAVSTQRTALQRCRLPSPTQWRSFTATSARSQQRRKGFYSRLGAALRDTKIQWYTIPVSVGIGFLGGTHFYKVAARERARKEEEEKLSGENDEGDRPGKPKKRPRVRPSGPWSVKVMSTLPLKALSRWWGWFNELDIPYYLRVPGFKLYSFVFGVK